MPLRVPVGSGYAFGGIVSSVIQIHLPDSVWCDDGEYIRGKLSNSGCLFFTRKMMNQPRLTALFLSAWTDFP